MRGCTLVVADVHADVSSLEAIMRTACGEEFSERYGSVDRILNLGDTVERGYHPGEVIGRLKTMDNLTSILGNHDEAFIRGCPISGSNDRSAEAHERYRAGGDWQAFFSAVKDQYLDTSGRLLGVHGGPLDPETVCPAGTSPLRQWLYGRTWQRISEDGERYFDSSGYHYLPGDAFEAARGLLGEGFIILCGHEHSEAAFVERDGRAQDVYLALERSHFNGLGRRIEEKTLILEEGENALVRLGIAGPEGYSDYYGMDRSFFGALYEKDGRRCVSLLNFRLDRDCMPE